MKRHVLLFVAVVTLMRVSTADAVPITYTQVLTASGSFGGTAFIDALVTLELVADTNTVVVTDSGLFYNFGPASVDIDGVGSATFSGPDMRVVDNPSVQGTGFSDFSESKLILFTRNAAFATYDLTGAIGPLTGQGVFNPGSLISTSAGNFSLTSVKGNVTFTARCDGEPCSGVPTAPEPGTALLVAAGALSVLGARARRHMLRRR
jgi:hypothetical protein